MSSRLTLKAFFAHKILSWESLPISLECAILSGEGRNPSAAFCRAQCLSREECCLTVRDVPEVFLVPKVAISGERSFFSITLWEDWTTRSRVPRGTLREGRGISDGFGFLHSFVTSHQWPCSASLAVTHPRAEPGALWQMPAASYLQ